MRNPPGSANGGHAFTAAETTKNFGLGTAGSSTTRYYLSTDTTFDIGDVLLAVRGVPGLASGEQSRGKISIVVPARTAAGSYFILACADDLNVVSETSESNNCRSSRSTMRVAS
jgi:subtilase family serine protease